MHARRKCGVQTLRQTLCDNRFGRDCNDCSRVCLQGLYTGQLLVPKRVVYAVGLVPSATGPKKICSRPILARLYRRATVIGRRQRHICGKLCPCSGVLLLDRSARERVIEGTSGLPAAIWLFHFLEIGEALPELVGEADWRPVSRAMVGEGLRVQREGCYRVHVSEEGRTCISFIDIHKAPSCSRLKLCALCVAFAALQAAYSLNTHHLEIHIPVVPSTPTPPAGQKLMTFRD